MKNAFMIFRFNLITIAFTFTLIASCILNVALSRSVQSCYEDKEILIVNGNSFMEASSYLTEEVRAYMLTGNEVHYNNYNDEVQTHKKRDIALDNIKETGLTEEELKVVNEMSAISNRLIPLEYKAMYDVKNGDFEEAKSYLYGEDYINDIQTINIAKEKFLHMLDVRTDLEISIAKKQSNFMQIGLLCLCILIMILQIIGHKKSKNTMIEIDVFSGIYNRFKYRKAIEEIMAKKTCDVGIVIIDINGLKQVNEEYGLEYGDNLILKVVDIMKECFIENVYRLGGDEFAAFHMNGNRKEFEEKVSKLRIMSVIKDISCVAIGSSWYENTDDILNQIAYTEELMYADKNTYYSKSQSKTSYRAMLANELQLSIEGNDFFVMLQPKFRLLDKTVVGAEALVRKKSKKGTVIPPDKFISIYETDGVISLLDFFVLESVCKILKEWKDKGYQLIDISVNFSRVTILEANVAERINDIGLKYGVDSKFITIELTERVGNIPHSDLNEILGKIQSFGFRVSLDDFGRDYANLSILSSIPFDEIKIDKSLIDDLATNPATGNATCCIIEMCNAYRPTEIVIEGIETQAQIEKLLDFKCVLPLVQGYYFSKPITIENFVSEYICN